MLMPLDYFKAFKEIIDEGVEKGLKAIRLNYINEPLIRKDIIDFIIYAKKKGIDNFLGFGNITKVYVDAFGKNGFFFNGEKDLKLLQEKPCVYYSHKLSFDLSKPYIQKMKR